MAEKPLLSVVTITYNQEDFITKTIEGVLMQKVNFPIEYILAEDCSTDGTRRICQEYAAKYPELIHLIISDTNVGGKKNEYRAMVAARGKYIAFCEGDDFWTDPMKLQRQVDFLESHPEYSACFHRYKQLDSRNNVFSDDDCGDAFKEEQDFVEITKEMYFKKWITQPLTMVYRSDRISLNLYEKYRYYRDTYQIYYLLLSGKIGLFSFNGGVRTLHYNSEHGSISLRKNCDYQVIDNSELYKYHPSDPILKKHYLGVLQWSIVSYIDNGWDRKRAMELIWRHFVVSKSVKRLVKNLRRMLISK